MKCLRERCYSPRACADFDYCRERNFDGHPMDQANVNRRHAESRRDGACADHSEPLSMGESK